MLQILLIIIKNRNNIKEGSVIIMDKVYTKMPLDELNEILKREVKDISLKELYDLSIHFDEERKYLPREYKQEYTESVIKVIVSRIAMLKNSQATYPGKLSEKDAEAINEIMADSDDRIEYILNIIVVFTTYLKKRPIHLPGTVFPGLQTIYSDGEDYYCPVKKYHIDNPNALCKYCIAKAV